MGLEPSESSRVCCFQRQELSQLPQRSGGGQGLEVEGGTRISKGSSTEDAFVGVARNVWTAVRGMTFTVIDCELRPALHDPVLLPAPLAG